MAADRFKINVQSRTAKIATEQRRLGLIAAAQQGAPGQNYGLVTKTAAIALSGHRMVVLNDDGKAIYADSTILTHSLKVVGMTSGAAAMDAPVTILTYGEITESSWNWTLDLPIFLSTDGLITQTPPTSGFSLVIGFPISSTRIILSLSTPILL